MIAHITSLVSEAIDYNYRIVTQSHLKPYTCVLDLIIIPILGIMLYNSSGPATASLLLLIIITLWYVSGVH